METYGAGTKESDCDGLELEKPLSKPSRNSKRPLIRNRYVAGKVQRMLKPTKRLSETREEK